LEQIYGTVELWPQYKENYLTQIGLSEKARDWMQKVAEESKRANVVLVCFEKITESKPHCHRVLLAEEIARRFNVTYNGELTIKDIKNQKS